MDEGYTVADLLEALEELEPTGSGALAGYRALAPLAGYRVIAHNPGTQTWLDVVGLDLDRERERVVLRLRGRT